MELRERKYPDRQAPPSYYDTVFTAQQASEPLFQPLPSPPPFVQPSIISVDVQASTSREVRSYKLGPDPVRLRCGNCSERVKTKTSLSYATGTYLCSCLVCILFLPLAYLPFVMDAPESVTHSCPKCNAMIGKYES